MPNGLALTETQSIEILSTNHSQWLTRATLMKLGDWSELMLLLKISIWNDSHDPDMLNADPSPPHLAEWEVSLSEQDNFNVIVDPLQ